MNNHPTIKLLPLIDDDDKNRPNPLLAVLFCIIIYYLVFVKHPQPQIDNTPAVAADSLFKTNYHDNTKKGTAANADSCGRIAAGR